LGLEYNELRGTNLKERNELIKALKEGKNVDNLTLRDLHGMCQKYPEIKDLLVEFLSKPQEPLITNVISREDFQLLEAHSDRAARCGARINGSGDETPEQFLHNLNEQGIYVKYKDERYRDGDVKKTLRLIAKDGAVSFAGSKWQPCVILNKDDRGTYRREELPRALDLLKMDIAQHGKGALTVGDRTISIVKDKDLVRWQEKYEEALNPIPF
jgi:hypothetical protein